MKRIIAICYLLFAISAEAGADAPAPAVDIDRWYSILHEIQNSAIEMNISNNVINDVIQPAAILPAVIKNDRAQAEFKLTLDQYLARMVGDSRVAGGVIMRKTYPTLLSRVDKKYGVPPHVILALWGLESNYGEFKARHRLTDAFLTLIYDGRRETFFKAQLFSLMKLADRNDLPVGEIHGSWAGAMGHFQFIPTTLEAYGADGNGDGRIDIINSVGDAMFSAGNYLSKLGWDSRQKIAREVRLPADFDVSLLDGKTKKPLVEWAAMGITNPNGSPIPRADMIAGVVGDAAAGPAAKAYLTYPNFYRIKKWNNSNWYAIAVAELAEKLKKD
jgi:membrane-bound lytic murein transglycosylase B